MYVVSGVLGTLVFDGVAISRTQAVRPLGLTHGRPRGGGLPEGDKRCSQSMGGAVYIEFGTASFKGGSSITDSTAVRFVQHTRARVHAHRDTGKGTHTHSRAHRRTNRHSKRLR